MFSKILVGYDGGQGSHDALILAGLLAATGAQITLVCAWSEPQGLVAVATGVEHPAKLAHDLLEGAQRDAEFFCGIAVRRATSPGAALHELAEELRADLIVVGVWSHQSPGTPRHHGDTISALHGARCSVAVASADSACRGAPVRRVGVAYQPDAAGKIALETARELARTFDAETHAMQVVASPPAGWQGFSRAGVRAIEEVSMDLIEHGPERLQETAGLTSHLSHGAPAEELIRFSADVDLLVFGSRGHGPAGRLLTGDVAAAVARASRCPVLIVPG